jgi:glutaminyl-tRNA synthetase
MSNMESKPPLHFIHAIVEEDLRTKKHGGKVVTRFPPEPNGYLHIGHAKAICLDFGTALKYGGVCHLRYDDTNPEAEEQEYIDAIEEDVRWLGFDWGPHLYYASDYFQQMYEYAVQLIRKGKAYVCDVGADEWKEYRGVPTRPGKESPHRDRSVEENLRLFEEMRAGRHPDGSLVLRARIDMASPNIHLRDPAIYRIKHAPHPHVGDRWCIYPMYDYAHCIEDSIEKVTHSLCTLEFEVHRPLYDWILDELGIYHPQQIEFARLNLTYTVMSKRRLLELVRERRVGGWDDPRLPTLCGLRRRGCTPAAIRAFCETVGVTKVESLSDVALLEHCLREDLNRTSPRRMAVLNPLRVIIENAAEIPAEVEAVNNPEDPAAGARKVPFSSELLIERDDFMEDPPKKYFRLSPGGSVRIRYAGFLTCTRVEQNAIVCTWSPPSAERSGKGGSASGGKVKGTIHWVSAKHAAQVEVRLYDRLFVKEDPMDTEPGKGWMDYLNPDSLKIATAFVEPSLKEAPPGARFQFERIGYFCADSKDSKPGAPVFNRTVTLKDSWAKVSGRS